MPSVPRREQGTGELARLQTPAFSTDAPGPSFVSTAESIGQSAQASLRASKEIFFEMKRQGDELAVLEANNFITKKRIDYTTEALKMQGKSSLDAYENYSAALGKDAQDASKNMNASQSFAFKVKMMDHDLALKSQLEAHTAKEMHSYRNNEITSGLERNQEDFRLRLRTELTRVAPADRAKIAVEQSFEVEKVTKKFTADFNKYNAGLPEEQLKLRSEGEISSLHANAMRELVNNKMTQEAKAYFEVHKGSLRGKDAETIPKMVEGEAARGNAEMIGDGIYGQQSLEASRSNKPMSLSSLNSAVDAAATKQNLSKEERQYLRSYTAMLWDREQSAIKADEDAKLNYMAPLIAKAPPGTPLERVPGIKPDVIASLRPDTRTAADGLTVERGVPLNYYEFVELTKNEQAFSRAIKEKGKVGVRNMINLIPVKGTYRARAEERWQTYLQGGEKAAAMFSDDKMLDAAIQRFGPDGLKQSPARMSDGDKTLLAAIQLNAAQLTADWNMNNPGKKLGSDPKQQVELYKQAIKGTIGSYPRSIGFGMTEERIDLMTPEQLQSAGLSYNRAIADPNLAPYVRGAIDRLKAMNPELAGMSDSEIMLDKPNRRRVGRASLYLLNNARSFDAAERDRLLR